MKTARYKKEYCDLLIKHMEQGYSFETWGPDHGFGRRTTYEWVKKYPEFADAKIEGQMRAQALYEKILRAKLSGKSTDGFDPKKCDTTLLIFALKTRFHKTYGEKVTHEIDDETKEVIKLAYKLD